MPAWILNLLPKIPFRVIMIVLGVIAVLGGEWFVYHKAWDAGYNKAQVEVQAANTAAISAAVEDARQQWEKASAAGASALMIEKSITRNLRDVEKRITAAVSSTDAACRNLGGAVLGVYNGAVDAANAGTVPGSP